MRNLLFSNLEPQCFDFLFNQCLHCVIYQPHKLNISSNQLDKLKGALEPDKKKVLYLVKKTANRKRKRKIVANQVGGGIGIAIATLLPLLISTIKGAIDSAKAKKTKK